MNLLLKGKFVTVEYFSFKRKYVLVEVCGKERKDLRYSHKKRFLSENNIQLQENIFRTYRSFKRLG